MTPPPQPLGGAPAPVISGKVARSAGLIGAATMTSRVLGLVREQVMAYLFGAGDAVDAFNVAFRIPNLVRDLFAEGAMSAAFVPTFTRVLARDGRSAAWRLGNNVVNALLLVTVALAVLGAVFAHPLVMLLAGQYANVPGKIELTVLLTRLMFPFLIAVTLAAASMGMLNALDRYFIPATAPAVFNVCTIATVVALVPVFLHVGVPTIIAMSCGVLVGGLGQVLLQAPILRREGYRYRAALDTSDHGLREILVLMGPGTLGLAATQVNVFVNTWLATSEGTGAVSWLNYAFRLVYLPLGVFGISIATASIPVIARHAAADDRDGLRQAVAAGVSMMLALTIPATLGLMVLARPIVALLFERGQFSPADTAATAAALVCYAVGLAGYSIVRVATPTFYALGDARTPVAVSIGAVVMNVALNLLLVRSYGYRGLALGTSVTALTNAGALLWLLSRRLHGLHGAHLASVATRMLVAATVMAGVAVAVDGLLAASLPGDGILAKLVRVGGSIGSGIAVLVVMTRALRVTEVSDVALALVSRLAGRPPARP